MPAAPVERATPKVDPQPAGGAVYPGGNDKGSDDLEAAARETAHGHARSVGTSRGPGLFGRLRHQETLLNQLYRSLVRTPPREAVLSYAAEWLLDNFYLVQQALRQIHQDMPESYYRQLPRLKAGEVRVDLLARAILGRCGKPLDPDRVVRFVRAYQEVSPLTMGELWALPTMLRLGSLEFLTGALARLVTTDRKAGGDDPSTQTEASDWSEATAAAHSILTLRWLSTQDWVAFFEGVSWVEMVLARDPLGVYPRMDGETRDRYRKVVEQLARDTGREESEVAGEAVRLAESAGLKAGGSRRACHVGYYLLDAGRASLESSLGYRPPYAERIRRLLLAHPTALYLGSISLLSVGMLLAVARYAVISGGSAAQQFVAAALAAVPIMAAAVYATNWLVTHSLPPRLLPRMDFATGVPDSCRTLVVIPALLGSAREVKFLLRQLELHYLGNADRHLQFALLTDFADAPQERMPEDEALLEELRGGVEALNHRHGKDLPAPFCLLHRPRIWNPAEECWMGWERKRGKLVELNRLILGTGKVSYTVQHGDLSRLRHTRYVITLDADTILPRDSARRLIATLAHPLNEAEFDPATGHVIAGYTVLQPRLEISPTSAGRSLFSRLFSGGDPGLDPYTRATSDVYQDLFGEGNYAGKGIYDVAGFEASLAGRIPENALLSHDLFEGIWGRTGLVSDVTLLEEFPSSYLAYARRLHRWVRGDWQLLPWLLPRGLRAGAGRRPEDLRPLDRWKILDNLRRSLVPLALLAWLAAGWLWLPASPAVWTGAALFTSATPLLGGLERFARGLRRGTGRGNLARLWADASRWLLGLAFLPYEALIMFDAIGTTLLRLAITRKHLLRWTTAAHTLRLFGRQVKLGIVWKEMIGASLLALVLASLAGWANVRALPVAAPLLLAWLVSPQVAHRVSLPIVRAPASLSAESQTLLRCSARRTWLYFERFIGPEDHWLAPDHFQEEPRGLVAHRTSPTNLGLMLLSTLAAYDLGHIGLMELNLRVTDAFDGMHALERYRGHFLNWYDTRSLQPLSPRYVSTVDSGNLAACLLALRQGCLAIPHQPSLGRQRWQGLLDTLAVLAEVVEEISGTGMEELVEPLRAHLEHLAQQVLQGRDDPNAWLPLLRRLSQEGWQRLEALLTALVEHEPRALEASTLRSLHAWADRVQHQLVDMEHEVLQLLPWLSTRDSTPALFARPDVHPHLIEAWQALHQHLPGLPSLDQVPEACKAVESYLAGLGDRLVEGIGPADEVEEARKWCEQQMGLMADTRLAARTLLIGLESIAARAEALFQEMRFEFLFDPQRQLFHVGYNVDRGKLDDSYYDLLASEARLASLVAISRGDVPQSHWLHLARPIARIDGSLGLLSWNGSMFEYLMPSLLVRDYEGALLEHSARVAAARQLAFGREKGVPWGISESGYYRFDAQRNYQYRGFGIPGLGLKRGLAEDLVVAPYASLLALSLEPQAVVRNLTQLVALGMLGDCGFYEAIDFTRSRLSPGQRAAIVSSYMAHHQAMVLLALTNHLQENVMVGRFHADPRVQSVELLLQEQVPRQPPVEAPRPEEAEVLVPLRPRVRLRAWRVPLDSAQPRVHALSNGRYSVLVTASGGGYSRWQDVDLTRWRSDTTRDDWGMWIYIQDCDEGTLWSATSQPVRSPLAGHEVRFAPHQAAFVCRGQGISLRTEITVAPEDDVEIRRLTVTNDEDRPRRLRLTSYGEVVLSDHAPDLRHPAFGKLSVESEWLPELNGLLFRRRPAAVQGKPTYLIHTLVLPRGVSPTAAYESDRAAFIGRGATPRSPVALSAPSHWLSGSAGATLDPIMALGQEIELLPYESIRLCYLTLAAASRQEVLALARRYRSWPTIDHAFERARTLSELQLHKLGLSASELEDVQRLLSILLYPHAALRASPSTLAANTRGQAGLWAYGISGDNPILLARIGSQQETHLVRQLLQAQEFWRQRAVSVDLVVLNLRDTAYDQELQGQLHRLVAEAGAEAWLNQRGGILILRADLMNPAERTLLETAARAVLDGAHGPLAAQLTPLDIQPAREPAFVPTLVGTTGREPTPPLSRPADLLFDNGLGGFSADGREYLIYLEPDRWTPRPWINVIAYPGFGFTASEAGSGNTWAVDSGENRLTPWSNDPVCDTPGEALYLRDEETGEIWSPTPLPARAPAPYLIRHGAGYSAFEHHSHGLLQRLRLFAVPRAPVKVIQLQLENAWHRARRLTATFYTEWVLGTSREETQAFVVSEHFARGQALLARNPYNSDFGQCVAFAAAGQELHGLTADRGEFLGRLGTHNRPAGLERIGLSGTAGPGFDPCAALQVHVGLAAGESKEVFFLLGQGTSHAEALKLIETYRDPGQVQAAWENVALFWDRTLQAVTVRTPDPAMDLMLNRWLLYQALSCRVWGRSALYQSAGGFGYRDQLQDVLALLHCAPEVAREHILYAARHQFEEGDVLHWWHPPSARGVRTRCSDDLLWLPFATTCYVSATADESILSERVPFLKSPTLASDERDRYDVYPVTSETETLCEHCLRALERGSTSGPHGLPLIGTGDWNDGLNRVGAQGRGESIWLGWFLYAALSAFAGLCRNQGDDEQACRLLLWAQRLRLNLETHGWDGAWYLRAYDDEGLPLGSAQNRECQIDSIAQSWAVLSGAAAPERTAQAMRAVLDRLVLRDERLVLLLAPPFDASPHDPGYIMGYPPGVRENGGQYTHAAVWVAWALAQQGRGDQAEEIFHFLNPIHRTDTRQRVARYQVEPFVVAADVYGASPHSGRGGWTWYTGSAAWMYRLGLEAILGVRRQGTKLRIQPCIPSAWSHYELIYRDGDTSYQIRVENPERVSQGVRQLTLDGEPRPDDGIPFLHDGKQHVVHVVMGLGPQAID